jgi:energy-coupling factor transporter ATP-binding protein EcfA2
MQRIWAAAKKTVLLITHSIPESIFLSDRVLVMSERRLDRRIYEVALPRPRTLAMMGSPEFAVLAQNDPRAFLFQRAARRLGCCRSTRALAIVQPTFSIVAIELYASGRFACACRFASAPRP